jgi:hypothetical protein
MGFIERELTRISEAIRARQAEHSDSDEYRQLYAAQQALSWALEPVGFQAPLDTILGTPAGLVDYPEYRSPAPS